ncbi:MAG: TonB-dependent receptor [Candidatus Marinimicrobia bacterium]|nr:TonB-dependent receptor [Candidatus Neomarinimicrobiota bacterium]
MKKLLISLILLISLSRASNVSGYVIDQSSGETIIGVNIMVKGTGKGTATDNDGFFILRNLAPGKTMLVFSHISYEPKELEIAVANKNLLVPAIELKTTTIETEAIEVTGRRNSIIEKDLDISSFEVDPIILFEVPQMNKDVFKLMKFLPSVTISDPASPQFHVRGSDPGENLVQLDGMTIYNPQHFMASEAIFNPYSIKDIEMLVGGFDAEYGGRNASILNITSREGHKDEIHGEFKPSISGISGALEFPVNQNSTAMISGRYYSDLMFRVMMNAPNTMSDIIGTFQTRLGTTRLSFTGFHARDFMDYNITGFTIYFPDTLFDDFEEGFVTNTANSAIGVHSHSVLLPNLLFDTHLYYSASKVKNKTYFSLAISDTSWDKDVFLDYETKITNHISDYTAKAGLTYFTFWNQSWNLGAELNFLDFENSIGESYLGEKLKQKRADLQAFYLQDKIDLGPLVFKAGLRNTRFRAESQWRLEPRLSLAMKGKISTLKLAWGRYNQYITTMNSKDNEFVQTLEYFNSLKNYEPIASEQFIAGIEGYINEDLFYSVTGYYKDLYRLYKFDYSDADEAIGPEQGKGKAYGIETLIRGKIGKLSGWASYTISRGTRSFPSYRNGKEYLYDGDQTHNLKTLLMYNLTRDITASTTFQFSSGYPKTWETGKYNQFNYDVVEDRIGIYPRDVTPAKNNVRYPPRMLLDIGWKKKLRTGFGHDLAEYLGADDAYFTMTIRNVLFLKRNPYYYFYLPDYGYYGFGLSYIPSITAGYSIKF